MLFYTLGFLNLGNREQSLQNIFIPKEGLKKLPELLVSALGCRELEGVLLLPYNEKQPG